MINASSTTKEIKAELARPAEPTRGPLKAARREIEIHELIWEEEHRFDQFMVQNPQREMLQTAVRIQFARLGGKMR